MRSSSVLLITVEILTSKSCYIRVEGRFNFTAATVEMSFIFDFNSSPLDKMATLHGRYFHKHSRE